MCRSTVIATLMTVPLPAVAAKAKRVAAEEEAVLA